MGSNFQWTLKSNISFILKHIFMYLTRTSCLRSLRKVWLIVIVFLLELFHLKYVCKSNWFLLLDLFFFPSTLFAVQGLIKKFCFEKRENIIFEVEEPLICISEQITRMKNVKVIVNLILPGNSVTRFLFKETKLFCLERVSYPLTSNLVEEFLKSSHFIRIFLIY